MKKFIIILVLFFVQASATSQVINFADTNLNMVLSLANSTDYQIAKNALGNWVRIDTNGDGMIQQSEANLIKWLQLKALNVPLTYQIYNIAGIENLTNLETLLCNQSLINTPVVLSNMLFLKHLDFSSNNIPSVSFNNLPLLEFLNLSLNNIQNVNISNLNNLKTFGCEYNSLISNLNFNGLINIENISFSYCNISQINFTGLVNLQKVTCSNNHLSNLDFSQNPLLKILRCENNNLTSLNIKNSINQDFSNIFMNDCWSIGNPNLTEICADASEVTAVQNKLNTCNAAQIVNVNSNCALGNDSFIANEFEVYPNPSSGVFNLDLSNDAIDYNKITIYNVLGKQILQFNLTPKEVNLLDLSQFNNGFYFAKLENQDTNTTIQLIKN